MSRLSSVEAHKPCCLVVVDHFGARFFRYWLGKMSKLGEQNYRMDVSQWKRKNMRTRITSRDQDNPRIPTGCLPGSHRCPIFTFVQRNRQTNRKPLRQGGLAYLLPRGFRAADKTHRDCPPQDFLATRRVDSQRSRQFLRAPTGAKGEPSSSEWTAKQAALKLGLPSRARRED